VAVVDTELLWLALAAIVPLRVADADRLPLAVTEVLGDDVPVPELLPAEHPCQRNGVADAGGGERVAVDAVKSGAVAKTRMSAQRRKGVLVSRAVETEGAYMRRCPVPAAPFPLARRRT
jgi:hypothetical protein